MAVFKDKEKTKDGRQWYFKTYKKDFNGVNRAYKSKRYLTKKEASEQEAIFLLKKDNPSSKNFLLVAEDYFKEYKKTRKQSSYEDCIYAYSKHIMPYFKSFCIKDINIPLIRKWMECIDKNGFSVNYSNKMYNILNNILNFAVINYSLSNNPLPLLGRFKSKNDKVIKNEEKLRYITLDDFNKFISVIDDITWKTFFIFLFYTGMRKGEVIALSWKDIDFSSNLIKVNKTLYYKHFDGKITSTKTGINRNIKMSKVLSNNLLKYKKEMMKYEDYNENWFVFGNSRFLPSCTIDRKKNYYFKVANITPITIHEFRHSHVSLLINEYVKSGNTDTTKFFLMMSNRMGHSVETMKKTYLHLFPTIQDEIVDLLDNL